MRLAVVTLRHNKTLRDIAKVTGDSLENYAAKCSAELVVFNSASGHLHSGYKKLKIADLLSEYARVLFIDTAILIRPDAPNLFEIVPDTHIGAYDIGTTCNGHHFKRQLSKNKIFTESQVFYDTSVLLVSKCHKTLFEPPLFESDIAGEKGWFNLQIFEQEFKVFDLPYRFNRYPILSKLTGEDKLDSYLINYTHCFINDPAHNEVMLETVKHDKECWQKEIKPYYPKRIFCTSSGGLGDVVCTEPVVRHIKNNFYLKDNFVLKTPYPEVFSHLESPTFKIITGEETIPDDGYYEINLMPHKDSTAHMHITHNLCHPTDYASIMAFKGQLAPHQKRIALPFTKPNAGDDLIQALSNSVLIHPGKGWPSKTFPSSWWDDVITTLNSVGVETVLFGSNTVSILAKPTFDFRGELPLLEMFGLIKTCPVLITNDSSPVHIAGAFDNYLILIQTCKEAFRILPHRYTSIFDQVSVFGKTIPRDISPNQVEPVLADSCDDISPFLPKPTDVAKEAHLALLHLRNK